MTRQGIHHVHSKYEQLEMPTNCRHNATKKNMDNDQKCPLTVSIMPPKQNTDNDQKCRPTMNTMPQKQNPPSKNSHQMVPKEMVHQKDTKQPDPPGHTNQVEQPPNSSLSAATAESSRQKYCHYTSTICRH